MFAQQTTFWPASDSLSLKATAHNGQPNLERSGSGRNDPVWWDSQRLKPQAKQNKHDTKLVASIDIALLGNLSV